MEQTNHRGLRKELPTRLKRAESQWAQTLRRLSRRSHASTYGDAGRGEIRTAVRNTADNRTGSVYASVTVPNFAREPLSLSGVVVERRSSGGPIFENLTSFVPSRPTTARVFSVGERVTAITRVYQRRGNAPAPVRVSARIVDGQDRAAFTADTTIEPAAFGADRQADYRLDLPLDRLVDGEYLLTLDASTGSASARRTLRFTVRRQP
jgi:hypothetical protein